MTRPDPQKGEGFHEVPLVLFSALTMGGAGVGTAHLGFSLLGWVPLVPPRGVMATLGGMLAVGLLFSMGHLGRPFRSPLALLRVGRSHLSNEILVVSVTLVVSLVLLALPAQLAAVVPLTIITLAGSVLSLLALGLVYRVRGQLMWRGVVWVQPFVLGTAFGLTVLLETLPGGTRARGELLIFLILLVDGLLVWERSRRMAGALLQGVPAHPSFLENRGLAIFGRILTGLLLPVGALLLGWWEVAGMSLFLNLFIDRVLFYGLSVSCGTEAEIRKAESALRAVAHPSLDGPESTPSFIRAGER